MKNIDIEDLLAQYGEDRRQQTKAAERVRGMARRAAHTRGIAAGVLALLAAGAAAFLWLAPQLKEPPREAEPVLMARKAAAPAECEVSPSAERPAPVARPATSPRAVPSPLSEQRATAGRPAADEPQESGDEVSPIVSPDASLQQEVVASAETPLPAEQEEPLRQLAVPLGEDFTPTYIERLDEMTYIRCNKRCDAQSIAEKANEVI